MKQKSFAVLESCVEQGSNCVLINQVLARYSTRELADQHANMLKPYYWAGELVVYSVFEEDIEIFDELQLDAIKLKLIANEETENHSSFSPDDFDNSQTDVEHCPDCGYSQCQCGNLGKTIY
jgi:hypothetical protein